MTESLRCVLPSPIRPPLGLVSKNPFLVLAELRLGAPLLEFRNDLAHLCPVVGCPGIFEVNIKTNQLKSVIHRLAALDIAADLTVVTAMPMLAPENADMALRFRAELLRDFIVFEWCFNAW